MISSVANLHLRLPFATNKLYKTGAQKSNKICLPYLLDFSNGKLLELFHSTHTHLQDGDKIPPNRNKRMQFICP